MKMTTTMRPVSPHRPHRTHFSGLSVSGVPFSAPPAAPHDKSYMMNLPKKLIIILLALCWGAVALGQTVPRFKICNGPYALGSVRLDTATGAVWYVQFAERSPRAWLMPIDVTSLLSPDEDEVPGRFDIFETDRRYGFLLLDTRTGHTWLVYFDPEDPDICGRDWLDEPEEIESTTF